MTCGAVTAGSTRMADVSCDEVWGRSPITGEVGRDGLLSISLSDDILLDETIVNWPVLLVLMRLI